MFESNKIDFIFNYSSSEGNVKFIKSEKYTYRVFFSVIFAYYRYFMLKQ